MLGDQQPDTPDEPLLIEPISGWRSWRVENGQLTSPDQGTQWQAGALSWDGECRCGRADDCWCGINAFAEREQLADSRYIDHMVIGRVELTGRVRGYELGWRAEHARVVEIWAATAEDECTTRQVASSNGAAYMGVVDRDFIDWSVLERQHEGRNRRASQLQRAGFGIVVLAGILTAVATRSQSTPWWPVAIAALLALAMYAQLASIRALGAWENWYISRHHLPHIGAKRIQLIYSTVAVSVLIGTFAPLLIVIAAVA